MLVQLEIFNLATFKEARLEFSAGLNILSGMSGAGKSVILKALDLVLGGRFSQKLIPEGQAQTEVAALFHFEPIDFPHLAGESEDGHILVRRKFRKDGKTVNTINDKLISAEGLKQIGNILARTLSQDESLGLRDPIYQLKLLDSTANLTKELEDYQSQYRELRSLENQIKSLEENEQAWARERQFLEFQTRELSELELKKGELAELESEYQTLSHSEQIRQAIQTLCHAADSFESGCSSNAEQLLEWTAEDHAIARLAEEGIELREHLREWARSLHQELSTVAPNGYRLSECEQRLSVLRSACKKFGMDHEHLVAHYEELKDKVDGKPPEYQLKSLKEKAAALHQECLKIADAIHRKRQKKSVELSKNINRHLERMEMPGDRFAIELSKGKELGPDGRTQLEFMLRATSDGPYNPLHSCASGGERSRAMLAICSACSTTLSAPILVFDEIDTNIGSRLGKPISDAFLNLSRKNQLICVTHLAPVAASGEKHFLVEKDQKGSRVEELPDQKRILELAQMIAGEKNSKSAIDQAKHMLKHYQN